MKHGILSSLSCRIKALIKSFFCILMSAGLPNEEYKSIRPYLADDSRRRTRAVCIVSFGVSLTLAVNSYLNTNTAFDMYKQTLLFGSFALLLCFVFTTLSRSLNQIMMSEFAFLSTVYAIGIALHLNDAAHDYTVAYMVFIVAAPMMLNWRPVRIVWMLLVYSSLFCVLVNFTKTPDAASVDVMNCIIYTFLSIIMHMHFSVIKAKSYAYLLRIERMGKTDSLTDLENRTSYDQFEKSCDSNSSVGLFVLDIDDLKRINDKFGHDYGNRVIALSAKCIAESFAPYGRCFRYGGDEFCVAIDLHDGISIRNLCERLERAVESANHSSDLNISISYGYAGNDEFPKMSVKDLFKIADVRMYEKKQNK